MLGVVMAGGESRRLGVDKALITFAGEPLWQRQVRVLRESGATRTVMIRRRGQPVPEGIECWHDEATGAGPLAGLHAALAPQASEWVAVLAVDMPGIGPEWFRRLQTQCGPGVGAMVRHAEACEPLAAIYPREALSEVTRRLGRGEGSLQALAAALLGMGQLVWVTAEPADLAAARSINTRADHSYWKTTDPETLTRFVTP